MAKRDDDAPWTEEQWEEFMRTGDVRAARYAELMETLLDDPERDDIIDKEMGWDRKRDDQDREWLAELQEAIVEDDGEEGEPEDDDEPFEDDSPAASQSDQLDQMRLRRRGELHAIPAYVLCEEASALIDPVVQPLLEASKDDDHDLAEAFIQMKIACAKIAGGHGMGYEDEVLGGNVVNCKRALAAANQCMVALEQLVKRRIVTRQQADPMLAAAGKSRIAIEKRIAELRTRMWWQPKH